ncbi:SLAM family member 5 [Labeo rohita]|uniref:SLAM family member 5 n=1 Tax=Labeo rohita TaxID=84645 RepID=A0ABQ8L7M3_LABRO|nr:SLAM family member 5 [Labeo rohita]
MRCSTHSGSSVSSCQLIMKNLVVSGIETDVVESVSVIVGDSVTLQTDVTQIQSNDVIEWIFEECVIATVNSDSSNRVQVNAAEKFRDKLQLDNQTGDLKIRDIRTADSGLYELDINRFIKKDLQCVIDLASDGVTVMSVIERDSVILPSGLTKIQREDQITWKFKDTIIAEINPAAGLFSTYDNVVDGRFRYRLHLNNHTGSLIITNVKPNISGLYEINISKSSSRYTTHKTFNVTSIGESTQ